MSCNKVAINSKDVNYSISMCNNPIILKGYIVKLSDFQEDPYIMAYKEMIAIDMNLVK